MTKFTMSLLALALVFGMTSCGDTASEGAVSKPVENAESTTTEADRNMDPLQEQREQQEQADAEVLPTTSIAFMENAWDFGNIEEGDKVTHVFKFTNTGSEPLILEKCKGSCGCTVPQCPKEPIAPGEGGEITVTFNSKGKPGNQKKSVTIMANTAPVTTALSISAQVNPAPKEN